MIFLDGATTPDFLAITELENHVDCRRMSRGSCGTALPQDMSINQQSSQVCHGRVRWLTLQCTTLLGIGYGMDMVMVHGVFWDIRLRFGPATLLGTHGCDLRWFRLFRGIAEKEEC